MLNLVEAIRRRQTTGEAPVIAEIKRLVPRLAEGDPELRPDPRDAGLLAARYVRGGAAAISLVAEREHFAGRPEVDVPRILAEIDAPLLIKDFVQDRRELDAYTRQLEGWSPGCAPRVTLLLLIHRLREPLSLMLEHLHQAGLLGLVETRGVSDLPALAVLAAPPALVSINNKDIDDLERGPDRLAVTAEMVARFREVIGDAVLISASAHRAPEDVRRSLAAGADAVLAGTAFMAAADPEDRVRAFVASPLRQWSEST